MKTRWGAALTVIALLIVLVGAGPCERKMPDSIEAEDKFIEGMTGGEKLSINAAIQYLVGPRLDPDSVTTSSVVVRLLSDGTAVPGVVKYFLQDKCDPVFFYDCPRGVALVPNDGMTCDLQGDTVYELVLDGLLLTDGSTLPAKTITFRTRPVPDGYSPTYCTSGPSWWTVDALDPVDGLSLGIAGDSPFVILVTGVATVSPFDSYDLPYETTVQLGVWDYLFSLSTNTLPQPPYLPLLVIENTGASDYDLSLLPDGHNIGDQMIRVTRTGGDYVDVILPDITIPATESLFLYFDADGSSYYAYDDSGTHTYTLYDQYPSYMLEPPTAFAATPAATW